MGEWYAQPGGLVVPRLLRPSRGGGKQGPAYTWGLCGLVFIHLFFNAAFLRRLLDIFPPKCLFH